ncbi:hypothetical protein Dimus_000318 [Dionaea muscipula]
MAPSRVAGGIPHSPASSGIFFQGDGQSQNMTNKHFASSFGNSANSILGGARTNLGPVSGDFNQGVLNSVATSGPSIGASSLVTDANSSFSGGPQLQRSASINTESYMRLPASPLSFSSNNISVSGSSIIDGSPTVQQNSKNDPSLLQGNQNQQQLHQGASSVTSLPTVQAGQVSLPSGSRLVSTVMQDPNNLSHMQKKPRLDVKQEDIFQHQLLQQLLQRNDMQLPGHNPQYQAYIQQQQRLRQQQYLQAMPQMQRAQLQQQHQQQQLKNHLQQQGIQHMAAMKNPYDSNGVCARRLMQYLYHQRQRGPENTIAYWRKFVAEYYAPRAKKRWCLSLYDNVGHHALGAFPQAAMDAWHCEICGARSGRGFEATYEVLPRLNEIKFSSGVLDEILFLDWPRERRYPSGMMILEYAKAVQESVYEQLRIVREGQLRILFTQDLKILSWEFCARRHEEFLPRRLVAPQVSQLLQVVQKCQSMISDAGSDVVSSQDLQVNSNMIVTAGRQLAKSLDLQTLNDLGFSKRYVRCLQIAEVVNNMKDLIDFCTEAKLGPIEGLKNYLQHSSSSSTSKIHMQKLQQLEQMATMQGLPTDRNTLGKLMALQSADMSSQLGTNNNMVASRGTPSSSAAAAVAFTNYSNMLMRPNHPLSTNVNSPLQQETSLNNSISSPGSMPPGSGSSTLPLAAQQPPLQFQHRNSLIGNGFLQQNQPPTSPLMPTNSQALQNQMIQQLLQDMSNDNVAAAGQHKPLSAQNGIGIGKSVVSNDTRIGNCCTAGITPGMSMGMSNNNNMGGGSVGGPAALHKSNSFKAGDSSAAAGNGNIGLNHKAAAPDLPQDLQLPVDIPDITDDFSESGFFGSDLGATMGYGWKA